MPILLIALLAMLGAGVGWYEWISQCPHSAKVEAQLAPKHEPIEVEIIQEKKPSWEERCRQEIFSNLNRIQGDRLTSGPRVGIGPGGPSVLVELGLPGQGLVTAGVTLQAEAGVPDHDWYDLNDGFASVLADSSSAYGHESGMSLFKDRRGRSAFIAAPSIPVTVRRWSAGLLAEALDACLELED